MNGRKAKAIRRAARKLSGLPADNPTTYTAKNVEEHVFVDPITEREFKYTTFTAVMSDKCLRSVIKLLKKAS